MRANSYAPVPTSTTYQGTTGTGAGTGIGTGTGIICNTMRDAANSNTRNTLILYSDERTSVQRQRNRKPEAAY